MGVTSTGSSSSRDEWAHRHQYRLSVEACNLPPLSATTSQPRVGAQHSCQQEEAHMRSDFRDGWVLSEPQRAALTPPRTETVLPVQLALLQVTE